MISRHAFCEDAFMVLSNVLHPLRGAALCFFGVKGPLDDLLLQQNGENMLLPEKCVYNHNKICEVL